MQSEKRKRATNFTEEEKMRFLRLLQEKGNVIISKVTSHDCKTNRLKEDAWIQICNDLNAGGNTIRTTDTLKKQWQKLKSEAKTFKSVGLHQVRGTGGGPSKKMDDPVLEVVIEITGRGSTGIESVADSDSKNNIINANFIEETNENEELIFSPATTLIATPVFNNEIVNLTKQGGSQTVCFTPTSKSREPPLSENSLRSTSERAYMKRRRPQLSELNERTVPSQSRIRLSNNLISKRVESENEKLELIKLKRDQEKEYHNLRMENQKRLFLLKETILTEILSKLQGGSQVDPEILNLSLNFANCTDEK